MTEDLTKKTTLLRLGIAGIADIARGSVVESEDVLPLEELAREIEQGLVALGKRRPKADGPARSKSKPRLTVLNGGA